MQVLLVDSYDSFTHNLAQALGRGGVIVRVVKVDRIDVRSALDLRPHRVVLGPGPGRPEDHGCLVDLARVLPQHVPTLGVCLGHQAIGMAFGAQIEQTEPVHGWATTVHHDGKGIFTGVPPSAAMTRYHSLAIAPNTVSPELQVSAYADDGVIMAVRHRTLPLVGVQFHPESVLSGAAGQRLVDNFLRLGTARHGHGPATLAQFGRTGTVPEPQAS